MNHSGPRIIAVDDEYHTLRALEEAILAAIPDCKLHGFSTPRKALEYAEENIVDVAFLDIEMPGMNGLALAMRLKALYGKANIVFVTGHSEYALDSYGVDASGYLLKPISEEAVIGAMERLRHPVERKAPTRVFVQTFGNFEVFLDGRPISFSRRAEAKEVLAYLIDRRGTSATTAEIAAVLWEDREYTRSVQSHIQNIISYMMQVLRENGIDDIIVKKWNSISIDRTKLSCDYYDLLDWNLSAINAFDGKYMDGYAWAEITTGSLCRKIHM